MRYLGKTEQTKYALKWTTNINKQEIRSHKNLITVVWANEVYIVYILTIVLPAIKRVTGDTFVIQLDSALQRIGAQNDRTVGAQNPRFYLSGSVAPQQP